ncbi:MAG TPA: hypothetical protein DCY94_02545 [Firmicutes bacterium]|nr:hypothetical protein [Bacillota bacterium]
MKFGDNLKNLRAARHISQEVLGEKVGVSRQSVSKWETGEAYPEMNNILMLCKIFNCKISDLVHEDMSDIDSLDEEIKMKTVKFKSDEQKKMKKLSRIISSLSKIMEVAVLIGIIVIAVSLIAIPFVGKNLKIGNGEITFKDMRATYEITNGEFKITDSKGKVSYANIESKFDLKNFLENTTMTTKIVYTEIIGACLIASLVILYFLLKNLAILFENIHDGETPFTLVNIELIKKIAYLILAFVLFPAGSGMIFEFFTKLNLGIEFELSNFLIVLTILSLAYIFEYGYRIQKDSKGVMYDESKN